MFRSMRLMTLALAAGLLPLAAQEPAGFSAAASVANGTSSLQVLTGGRLGFSLEGAWDVPSEYAPVRLSLSYTSFAAKTHPVDSLDVDGNVVTADGSGPGLTTLQLAALFRSQLSPKVTAYFGLTANKHRLSADMAGQGASMSVPGTKLGLRADVDYQLSKAIALTAGFQWVEVGLAASLTSSHQPSWFQLGARYRF